MQAWTQQAQARGTGACSQHGRHTTQSAVHHHVRPSPPRARVRTQCAVSADGAVGEGSASGAVAEKHSSDKCEEAKVRLFRLVDGTQRGISASRATRVAIQEAALALEAYGQPLDLDGASVGLVVRDSLGPGLTRVFCDRTATVLSGRWRLCYTTASDVLVLLEAERASFGLLQIGDSAFIARPRHSHRRLLTLLTLPGVRVRYSVFQSFDSYGSVENLIYASATPFLVPDAGVALRVRARYAVAGSRSIRLAFESASLGDVRINETLETLVAPALLPRTPPQMWLLQALRELNITLPLPGSGRSIDASPEDTADGLLGTLANGGAYLLGYCDADTLVGRALTGGGLFIFKRVVSRP